MPNNLTSQKRTYYFSAVFHTQLPKKYLLLQNICNGNIEIADNFFSLDYFPYQSKKYKDPGEGFASINLFKEIIEWGKKRDVLFLIMRKGVGDQLEAKYLNGYKNVIEVLPKTENQFNLLPILQQKYCFKQQLLVTGYL